MNHSGAPIRTRIPLLLGRACATGLLAFTLALAGCGASDALPFGGAGSIGHASGGTGDQTPGTGGTSPGSGGLTGGGGALTASSGGDTGTGGVGTGGVGSGGLKQGSGGRSGGGTGGITPGSGGRLATGGTTGSGGISATGGNSGVDMAKCDQLASDYLKELVNAKMCTAGALDQCQKEVPSSLGCRSGCTTYVQDAANLSDLAMKWTKEGCDSVNRVCPAIACLAPLGGDCVVSGSVSRPQCQNKAVFQN